MLFDDPPSVQAEQTENGAIYAADGDALRKAGGRRDQKQNAEYEIPGLFCRENPVQNALIVRFS